MVISEILLVKLEKFDSNNFRRWQNQIRFWLTTLNLITTIEPDNSSVSTPITPQEIEYHCLHRILKALPDRLYDIYYVITSAKTLRDTLEKKHGLDDIGIKYFKASDFNKFKMALQNN